MEFLFRKNSTNSGQVYQCQMDGPHDGFNKNILCLQLSWPTVTNLCFDLIYSAALHLIDGLTYILKMESLKGLNIGLWFSLDNAAVGVIIWSEYGCVTSALETKQLSLKRYHHVSLAVSRQLFPAFCEQQKNIPSQIRTLEFSGIQTLHLICFQHSAQVKTELCSYFIAQFTSKPSIPGESSKQRYVYSNNSTT